MATITTDPATFDDTGERPAVVRIAATLDIPEVTPLRAYQHLSDHAESDYAFLLESAEKIDASDPDGAFRPSTVMTDRHARYSFVGYNPVALITIDPSGTHIDQLSDDPLASLIEPNGNGVTDSLRTCLPDVPRIGFDGGDRQRLEGGLVGYLAYDAVYDMWLSDVGIERPASPAPDAQFVLATNTVVFDELEGTCELVCTHLIEDGQSIDTIIDTVKAEAERVESLLEDGAVPPQTSIEIDEYTSESQEAYEDAVRVAKDHVRDGDIYQGVLSRSRTITGTIDVCQLYAALRDVNPSPYMYLLEFGDRSVVGASPETLVSVRGDLVTSNPIAGTCPRGNSPVEDRRLAGEMLADEKELAEHTMLVDLGRNDVRRVSRAGSVRVDEFMNVLKYSHVQHIESTVTGRLAPDADAFDATKAAFPAGTLSGAPKIRAMEIIDKLEASPRGIYGGGVGYFSWTGDADFAIVIRSAILDHTTDQDRVTVRAGAGIVADSDPTSEYEETESKMDAVLTALERAGENTEQPAEVR